MKTRYKHIHFVEGDEYWDCYNNKDDERLGYTVFDLDWKQWVFISADMISFSASCLCDIAHFLEQLKEPE